MTNPPFSLFREYVAVLMERGKRFAVIGNRNAVSCKEFFPLLRDDRLWVGETHPKRFLQSGGGVRVLGNVCWFTNLDIGRLHVPLPFTKRYRGHEDAYPVYDGMRASFLADYFAQGGTGAVYPGHPDLGYYTPDGRAVVPYRRVLVRNCFPVS